MPRKRSFITGSLDFDLQWAKSDVWLTCGAQCDEWDNQGNFEFSLIFISIAENKYAQIHSTEKIIKRA